MKKRILSMLLVLAMVLCMLPTVFAASSGTCGNNLSWTLDDQGTLTISGNGAMTNFNYGSSPFHNSRTIKTVIIKSGVTTIGSYAFPGCNSLTSVTIPNSVTSIENGAFLGCDSLTRVTIPDSVTLIGSKAFSLCINLTTLDLGDGVTTIGDNAFLSCCSLTSVTIPRSITTIDGFAFRGCTSLTSVTIPDSVTTIADGAFSDCTKLREINVDSRNASYKSVDGVLFNKAGTALVQCPAGKSGTYTIADTVTSISTYAFYGCSSLTGKLVIPDSVTTIGDYTFSGCSGLTRLDLGDGVTTLGYCAFSGCSGLTGKLVIPDSMTTIGSSAFDGCRGLTGLDLGNGVNTIGDTAFSNCSGLTGELVIPYSVTSITWRAFFRCSGLSKITFQGNAPSFGADVFYDMTATAYYPTANSTWTSNVRQNYGGHITWAAMGNVVSLEIASLPRVSYWLNEKLDLTNLHVLANYSNGRKGEISIDRLTVSPCDMSTSGKKTVTVSYEGLSASFTVFVHRGYTAVRLDKASYPESAHSYLYNTDETQSISYAGAGELVLVFSQDTHVEPNWDWIYVYDGNGNQIAQYTGTQAAGATVTVPGDTAKIRLVSDFTGASYYGYSFDSITANCVTHTQQYIGEIAPTCTEPGYVSAYVCEICGEVLSAQRTIPANGHTGGPVCSVCGEAWVSGGDIDMDGSVTVVDMLKLKPLILANKWSDDELALGDLDNDGKLSVKDIMLIKNLILNQ